MIKKVVKATWMQPDGKIGFQYTVYYEKRKVVYNWQKNIPMTVLFFLLDANCETKYASNVYDRTVKYETYTALGRICRFS